MDPMSALSIAASVVQFVDFGRHLLSASYEIYKSPSGEAVKELEVGTISKDLTDLVAQIKDKVGTAASGKGRATDAEYQLVKISEECEEILTKFRKALDGLAWPKALTEGEGAPKKARLKMARGAIRKALMSVWTFSELDGMVEQLEKVKGRLMAATLFCLWDESKRREHRDILFGQRLDEMIDMLRRFDDRVHLIDKAGQKTMHSPPNKIDSGTSVDLGPAKDITKVVIDALNDGRSTEGVLIHEQLVEYLWNQHRTPGHRNWIEREPASTSNESAITQNTFRDAITESLTYETIEGREETIPKAFEKTFSWIFFREPY